MKQTILFLSGFLCTVSYCGAGKQLSPQAVILFTEKYLNHISNDTTIAPELSEQVTLLKEEFSETAQAYGIVLQEDRPTISPQNGDIALFSDISQATKLKLSPYNIPEEYNFRTAQYAELLIDHYVQKACDTIVKEYAKPNNCVAAQPSFINLLGMCKQCITWVETAEKSIKRVKSNSD